MKSAEVRDILGEEAPIVLQSRHFVRFYDSPTRWIDVELRHGEMRVRGSHGFLIEPSSANQIVVRLP